MDIDRVVLLVLPRRAAALIAVVPYILLQPIDEPHQLLSFDLFRIEVVGFSYIKVGDYFLCALSCKHVLINQNIMVVLVVLALLEVVNDSHLGWIVFEHKLGRHGGNQTA